MNAFSNKHTEWIFLIIVFGWFFRPNNICISLIFSDQIIFILKWFLFVIECFSNKHTECIFLLVPPQKFLVLKVAKSQPIKWKWTYPNMRCEVLTLTFTFCKDFIIHSTTLGTFWVGTSKKYTLFGLSGNKLSFYIPLYFVFEHNNVPLQALMLKN